MTNSINKYIEEVTKIMRQHEIIISDALKKQLIKSVCSECPVCGETVFNQAFLGPDLRKHILNKNDDAHLILEVMNS